MKNYTIEELNLSVRTANCLSRSDILNLYDLLDVIEKNKIRKLRNLGNKSIEEINEAIFKYTGIKPIDSASVKKIKDKIDGPIKSNNSLNDLDFTKNKLEIIKKNGWTKVVSARYYDSILKLGLNCYHLKMLLKCGIETVIDYLDFLNGKKILFLNQENNLINDWKGYFGYKEIVRYIDEFNYFITISIDEAKDLLELVYIKPLRIKGETYLHSIFEELPLSQKDFAFYINRLNGFHIYTIKDLSLVSKKQFERILNDIDSFLNDIDSYVHDPINDIINIIDNRSDTKDNRSDTKYKSKITINIVKLVEKYGAKFNPDISDPSPLLLLNERNFQGYASAWMCSKIYRSASIDLLNLPLSSDEIRAISSGTVERKYIQEDHSCYSRDNMCEQIFGSAYDFRCDCGKYKGKKFNGTRCEHCGVEVTSKSIRWNKFGHIDLPFDIFNPFLIAGDNSLFVKYTKFSCEELQSLYLDIQEGYILVSESIGVLQKDHIYTRQVLVEYLGEEKFWSLIEDGMLLTKVEAFTYIINNIDSFKVDNEKFYRKKFSSSQMKEFESILNGLWSSKEEMLLINCIPVIPINYRFRNGFVKLNNKLNQYYDSVVMFVNKYEDSRYVDLKIFDNYYEIFCKITNDLMLLAIEFYKIYFESPHFEYLL